MKVEVDSGANLACFHSAVLKRQVISRKKDRCTFRPPIILFPFASDFCRLPVRGRAQQDGEKGNDQQDEQEVDALVQFGRVGICFRGHGSFSRGVSVVGQIGAAPSSRRGSRLHVDPKS